MKQGTANAEIRAAAKRAALPLWKVAEASGIADTTFSKRLRHELPEDQKREFLAIIEKLAANR